MGEKIRKKKGNEEEKKGPTIVDLSQEAPKKNKKTTDEQATEQSKESPSEQTNAQISEQINNNTSEQIREQKEEVPGPASDVEATLNAMKESSTQSLPDVEQKEPDVPQEKPSYYGEYEEPCKNSPLFKQIYNGCGFSSMLVLLDPIKNQNLTELFDILWNQIKKILTVKIPAIKELQWSYVLEYLLLKSNTDGILSEFLYETLPDDFDISRALLNDRLIAFQAGHENSERTLFVDAYKAYFDQGIVNPVIIDQHIRLMKENWELKPLFALFGYQFNHLYAPIGSSDGIGAIYFDRKELQGALKPEILERMQILKTEFDKGARIIYAIKDHWMPVTGIIKNSKGYFFTFNDSYRSQKYTVALSKLMNSNWFYIFRKDKDLTLKSIELLKKLPEWTQSEIEKESKAFSEFSRRIQEHLKKEGQKPKDQQVKLSTEEITAETGEAKSQAIGGVKITSEILDLSSSQPVQEKNLEPMSGDAFKDYIKQIIRSKFSDYEKL